MGTTKKTAKKTNDIMLKKGEVCDKLRVCLRTLNYYLAAGKIPYVKFGGSVRIFASDVEKFIGNYMIK